MKRTEDTTRTSRAGAAQLTSAIRMLAVLLAVAAIVAAIAVSVSQPGTSRTTPVVLLNSAGPDTTPTGTGTVASIPTSQNAPVYQGPPAPTWTRVTETVGAGAWFGSAVLGVLGVLGEEIHDRFGEDVVAITGHQVPGATDIDEVNLREP